MSQPPAAKIPGISISVGKQFGDLRLLRHVVDAQIARR
jgi:hypothetical protein